MIDVSQWRASIGLWNYCQAASSRPANGYQCHRHSSNGHQCHSFKGALDSKSDVITSKALPAALLLIAFILLFISFTLHMIKFNYIPQSGIL